jgi:hypothetical protein
VNTDVFVLARLVNITGAVCAQKILVFVLQMEKNPSRAHVWGEVG